MRFGTLQLVVMAGLMVVGLLSPAAFTDRCRGCIEVGVASEPSDANAEPMSCCSGDAKAESSGCCCCCHGKARTADTTNATTGSTSNGSAPVPAAPSKDKNDKKPGCPGGCECPSRCCDTGSTAKVLACTRIVPETVVAMSDFGAAVNAEPASRGREAHLTVLRPPRS